MCVVLFVTFCGVSQWFTSYLLGRTQHIRYAGRSSNESPVMYGVPQGSVLGPILFILYMADLVPLIEQQGLVPHLYADDAQIVGSCDSLLQCNVYGSASLRT